MNVPWFCKVIYRSQRDSTFSNFISVHYCTKLYSLPNFCYQLVSVSFWGIYAIDRELIYPEVLDAIIPSVVNHILVS